MSLSRKPNVYGLDPFLSVDEVKANYYLGRIDIAADDEEGEQEALMAAARGEEPNLDKALPWLLLARGMFSYLYKKEMAEARKRQGRYMRDDFVPRPIVVQPHDWARAFNFITTSYIQNEYFRKPNLIHKQVTENGRQVALAVLVTSPGKGIEKSGSYVLPGERLTTVKRLRRMERHRKNLEQNREVQDYLASLRDPTVSG